MKQYKQIDQDIIAKSEELYPIKIYNAKSDSYITNKAQNHAIQCQKIGFQQGAMDERQRINEEISKIESWITENRPHLTGLGALTAMLKQVKAVETLPLQITKSN